MISKANLEITLKHPKLSWGHCQNWHWTHQFHHTNTTCAAVMSSGRSPHITLPAVCGLTPKCELNDAVCRWWTEYTKRTSSCLGASFLTIPGDAVQVTKYSSKCAATATYRIDIACPTTWSLQKNSSISLLSQQWWDIIGTMERHYLSRALAATNVRTISSKTTAMLLPLSITSGGRCWDNIKWTLVTFDPKNPRLGSKQQTVRSR